MKRYIQPKVELHVTVPELLLGLSDEIGGPGEFSNYTEFEEDLMLPRQKTKLWDED